MTSPFCRECRYFDASPGPARLIPPGPAKCTHSDTRDLVGDAVSAMMARRDDFGACGPEGKLFEERGPEPEPVKRPRWPFVLGLLIVGIVLYVSLSGCGLSNEQLRIAYHAANVADGGTTVARDPRCMVEGNPALGSNPSDPKVWLFVGLQSLLYELICSGPAREQGEEKACRIAFLGLKGITLAWNGSQLAKGCD